MKQQASFCMGPLVSLLYVMRTHPLILWSRRITYCCQEFYHLLLSRSWSVTVTYCCQSFYHLLLSEVLPFTAFRGFTLYCCQRFYPLLLSEVLPFTVVRGFTLYCCQEVLPFTAVRGFNIYCCQESCRLQLRVEDSEAWLKSQRRWNEFQRTNPLRWNLMSF